MKRNINFLLLALATILTFNTACSDDDYEPKTNSVQVLSATTSIAPNGGEETIEVTGQGITASAADDWLKVSVNGNTVTVSAIANPHRTSRHTLLTIKAENGDFTQVNISQYGQVLVLDTFYSFGDEANTYKYYLNHNVDVNIVETPDWLDVSITDDSLIFVAQENNLGHWREGYVRYEVGGEVNSFFVRQVDFSKDIAGTYYLCGNDSFVNPTKTIRLKGRFYEKDGQYLFELTDHGNLAMPIDINLSTLAVTISAGYYMGTYETTESAESSELVTRYVYTILYDEVLDMETWRNYSLVGILKYDAQTNSVYTSQLYDDGSWLFGQATGLRIGYFSEERVSTSTRVKTTNKDLVYLAKPWLERISNN